MVTDETSASVFVLLSVGHIVHVCMKLYASFVLL